ncbi:MAG: hypothetical protein HEP71_00180 [Roseivirga sp.]|nr:hypothetical protein [Roseivirga sp.]
MHKAFSSLILLAALFTSCQIEKVQRIKNPEEKENKRCKRYIEFRRNFPIEEYYSIHYMNGMLYLAVSHAEHIDELFKKGSDGFAVDIIKKEQYSCDRPNTLDDSWAYNGTLLPPLFKKDFPQERKSESGILIPYRKLPKEFDPANVEYNLVVAQKKWRCDYIRYTHLERSNWSLLPTGLYRDSIPESAGTVSEDLSKTADFTLYFEYDQSAYDSTLLKPFYDTLNLTDFKITGIRIDAFASVEGNTARNTALLKQRAQRMFEAMQTYQTEKVPLTVNTKENWTDFFEDVKSTPFAHLADLPKAEIKNLLNTDKGLLQRLEPLLELHRKANIRVQLEKRYTVETDDPEILKKYLSKRVNEKNLEEALFIQKAIFSKIKNQRLPEEFLDELEIPESIGNLPLLNNNIIFKHKQDISGITGTLDSFLKLLELRPHSPKIQFNVIALKTRLWSISKNNRYGRDIQARIDLLKSSDLNPVLVARLEMNYLILLTDYYHNARQYKRKNASLSQIYNGYRATRLTDEELMGLAHYLVYYSRYREAKDILRPRVRKESVSSDILFTYLGYALVQPDLLLKDSDFLRLMERAMVRDNTRFCQLFAPIPQGGLSFQLLENALYKSRFCDVCSNNTP